MSDILIDHPANAVVRITLNRPATLNALTRPMVSAFNAALDEAADDEGCRVVIITGAGRGFCSGQDMNAAADRSIPGVSNVVEKMKWQRNFAGMGERMRRMKQPVIAAVNGVAAGAGMAIALAADIRIIVPHTRFLIASVKIGLTAGESGISYHLPRWIGTGRAFEVMLTGRPIDAGEAVANGLAVRMVTSDLLQADALEQAQAILMNSPFAVAETKQLMWRSLDAASLDAALALENPTQIVANTTEDYKEALDAFRTKRSPVFKGQ